MAPEPVHDRYPKRVVLAAERNVRWHLTHSVCAACGSRPVLLEEDGLPVARCPRHPAALFVQPPPPAASEAPLAAAGPVERAPPPRPTRVLDVRWTRRSTATLWALCSGDGCARRLAGYSHEQPDEPTLTLEPSYVRGPDGVFVHSPKVRDRRGLRGRDRQRWDLNLQLADEEHGTTRDWARLGFLRDERGPEVEPGTIVRCSDSRGCGGLARVTDPGA